MREILAFDVKARHFNLPGPSSYGLCGGIELVRGSLCLGNSAVRFEVFGAHDKAHHHAGQRHDVDRQRNFRDGHGGHLARVYARVEDTYEFKESAAELTRKVDFVRQTAQARTD